MPGVTVASSPDKYEWTATYNLQFDSLPFKLYRPNLEVHADSGDIAFCVCIVCKTQQEARLPDAGVACQACKLLRRSISAH